MIRGLLLKRKVSSAERSAFCRFANGFEDIVASLEALTVSDVDEAASGIIYLVVMTSDFTDPRQKLGIMHLMTYLRTRIRNLPLRRQPSITNKLV